ncbi:MAG: hypothetical protein JWQ23_4281 [Herminiimonas sp.]|nr:hypothetical protein [Herminiimonas sp.]
MTSAVAPFLNQIDWRRPWLAPLLPAASPVLRVPDWRAELNAQVAARALRNHRGLAIRFVPQADLPANMAYEAYISATGSVPTRDNLHDFFNAMMWLTFPQMKVRLNALQAAEIARAAGRPDGPATPAATRGKLRDAATIFDENAALLVVRDPRWIDLLRNHQWHALFISQRADFMRDCEPWLFGHALIEKLVKPYKAITAHAWAVAAIPEYWTMTEQHKIAWIDETVAAQIRSGLASSSFMPLPVMGVPGWCENQGEAFYADIAVFRPKRGTGAKK